MDNRFICSLTPAQLALLQLYASKGTSDTKRLSIISGRSGDTIETQFKIINSILGTSKRDEALLLSIRRGWISLSLLRDEPA